MRYTKKIESDFLNGENVYVFELRISKKDIDESGPHEIERYVEEVQKKIEQQGFEPSGT